MGDGRKILTQDFEKLPPAAALAANLVHADYVSIFCGSLDHLPRSFARLDAQFRHGSKSSASMMPKIIDPAIASLSSAERKLVCTEEMTCRVNGGGPELRLKTYKGEIRLKRL